MRKTVFKSLELNMMSFFVNERKKVIKGNGESNLFFIFQYEEIDLYFFTMASRRTKSSRGFGLLGTLKLWRCQKC